MSDIKRVDITCWNCKREYSLLREFKGQPTLNVHCPFCDKAGVVQLAPYESPVKDIYASEDAEPFTLRALALPDVLPSEAPPPAEEEQA